MGLIFGREVLCEESREREFPHLTTIELETIRCGPSDLIRSIGSVEVASNREKEQILSNTMNQITLVSRLGKALVKLLWDLNHNCVCN